MHLLGISNRYDTFRHGFTHLEQDENILVSGASTGEVIAWNFKTAEKIHVLQANQRIMCLQVQWPIVITCTYNCFSTDEDNVKGVKLFNMEDQSMIRHIPCGRSTDLHIQGVKQSYLICHSYSRVSNNRGYGINVWGCLFSILK